MGVVLSTASLLCCRVCSEKVSGSVSSSFARPYEAVGVGVHQKWGGKHSLRDCDVFNNLESKRVVGTG